MTQFLPRTILALLAATALTTVAQPSYAAKHRARTPAAASQTYTVKRGDTLDKVAGKLGTDVATLASVNGLRKPYRLQPGQVIKGPRAAATKATVQAKSSGKSRSSSAETYTVARGDTLFSISKRLGVSADDLRAANGLAAAPRSTGARSCDCRAPQSRRPVNSTSRWSSPRAGPPVSRPRAVAPPAVG
jgi:LysM repeat protein